MQKLKALWKKDPGLFVSVSLHAFAGVCLIANFAFPPKDADATESVPVEMITTSELNQIMSGEETAKQLPKPQRRIDKVADLEEKSPAPPLAEAKKDTPTPPSPDKANDDPGQDEKATPETAVAPPPPPVPMPPQRPVEKAEAPTPPPKPAPKPVEVKPPPPDAEAMDSKPPPPPKPVPQPPVRPDTKEAKATPPAPPKRPDLHDKVEPKKEPLDEVAKLLAEMKPPKPVTKAHAGSNAPDAQRHNDFNIDKITALLDHETPQHRASSGHQLTQMASLGVPDAHAEKMSPSMMAQLDGWLIDHYRGCWSYFGLGATQDYVPSVRVRMAPDGSLIGQPALLNPPSDPNLRSLADSAVRAVNRCNPMPVPERFRPYYDSWRLRVVRFDPKEMS